MGDVRAISGVPTIAAFAGTAMPNPCAPVIVDTATGNLYVVKAGDTVALAGAKATDAASKTGTGSTFVLQQAPTINIPNITGTVSADSAAAGSLGEVMSSTVATADAKSLTSTTGLSITSITLTAGDWDVTATALFNTANTTAIVYCIGSISTTDNTIDQTAGRANYQQGFTSIGNTVGLPIGPVRFNVSGNTVVYLVAQSQFSISTNAGWGTIRARRVR